MRRLGPISSLPETTSRAGEDIQRTGTTSRLDAPRHGCVYQPPTVAATCYRDASTISRWLLLSIILAATSCLTGCGGSTSSNSTGNTIVSRQTSAAVARGLALYQTDGCAGCHSLDGTPGAGPSWRRLAGSQVTLSDGQTLVANPAYLTRHIVEPTAFTVRGYPAGIMAQAIEALSLKSKPADVAALVAFIEATR